MLALVLLLFLNFLVMLLLCGHTFCFPWPYFSFALPLRTRYGGFVVTRRWLDITFVLHCLAFALVCMALLWLHVAVALAWQ